MNSNTELIKNEIILSKKQANFYKNLNSALLSCESVSKSRRYGRDFFIKNFLKNPEITTSYMNTFLYLRSAELSAYNIKDELMQRLSNIGITKER